MKKLIEAIEATKFDVIDEEFKEYFECVEDLLLLPDVQKLNNYTQHLNTSRLNHSIYVSYLSYKVCKKLGLDYRSAARGGLLHDLYLYDWRVERQPEGRHAFAHPKVALRNAKGLVDLNDIECDSIEKHMWPITFKMPRYKESLIVSLIDTYSAGVEMTDSIINSTQNLLLRKRSLVPAEATVANEE